MELTSTPVAKKPSDCSPAEISSFVALAIEGGEIAPAGLARRVRCAERLVFFPGPDSLQGIAALKNPGQEYRDYIAMSSGAALPSSCFPYELGWVVVSPTARGRGLSYSLSVVALEPAGRGGVFATSHNDRMHSTLLKLGFVPAGSSYPSRLGDRLLQLFLRGAPPAKKG